MDRQDILIRLLKEGHISKDEFKMLYEQLPVMTSGYLRTDNEIPFLHLYDPKSAPFYSTEPIINTNGTKITFN